MSGEPHARAAVSAERVELILEELDSLPTLGAVAVRLLEVTADDDADAREVVGLVESDPALATRVLALCRCHERGRAAQVTTVERAVLLLGFEAVRCAVLAVQVFELVDGMRSLAGEHRGPDPVFDREAFWLHSLAVAVASERIAATGTLAAGTRPSEAFIAGLLHDIGQLVLHVLLPETFDQVCRVAETHSASLDNACRQIIGLDTHTAGKRLAEGWNLPPALVDVIWLNGQTHDALPDVPHRGLVSVVTLADALVRTRYINPGAHWSVADDLATLCVPVGIGQDDLDGIAARLHDDVAARAGALGMTETHAPGVLLRAICRANESLARANTGMRQRERVARHQARMLTALTEFHESIPTGATTADVLACIARSVASVFETRVVAVLAQSVEGEGWHLARLGADGRFFGHRPVEPPTTAVPLTMLVRDIAEPAPVAALLPWVGVHLDEGTDITRLTVLPLAAGPLVNALLLLRTPAEPESEEGEDPESLVRGWRATLAAGAAHDRAVHLTERLAEANRELLETREALARSRTMSTLGEVAAGAAHEMNNPLTVISGRSQLLAARLEEPELQEMAQEIFTQSHALSDMITALRSFAEPVTPRRRSVDLADLVVRVVQRLEPARRRQVQVNTVFGQALPAAWIDPDLVGAALLELLRNAAEAKGSQHIDLRVQTDAPDGRLRVEVRDDGEGLSEHALQHAFDPFFSARPAGRQPGLGLAHARRFVEAHGGRITLANGSTGGAVATIWLTRWEAEDESGRSAA